MKFSNRSEEVFKATLRMAEIELQITNRVSAITRRRGTTTGERYLRQPFSGFDVMAFEKSNRKKRYLTNLFNGPDINV